MNEYEIFELLKQESFSLNDLIEIATTDYSDFDERLIKDMERVLKAVLYQYGTAIDTYDSEYPNNPFYCGYSLEGFDFWLSYSGVAGHHWGNQVAFSVDNTRGCLYQNPLFQGNDDDDDDEIITDGE